MLQKRMMVFLVIAVLALTTLGAGYGDRGEFFAVLTGSQEAPPVATEAKGGASFTVSGDGSSLHFEAGVVNIENVVAAHIHVAPVGVNGPVVVTLCGGPGMAPPCTNFPKGIFVLKGAVKQTDSGMALDSLIAQMKAGNTYINVHTTRNPSGEVRGQIMMKHH